jgi:CIC family chloride channel protein
MSSRQNVPAGADDGSGDLLVLALLALVVGAAAGFVGAVFRLALEQADNLRNTLIGWAHGQQLEGFAIVVGACAAATLVAASLVRRFSPYASGSGIPHVEAVLHGELPSASGGRRGRWPCDRVQCADSRSHLRP